MFASVGVHGSCSAHTALALDVVAAGAATLSLGDKRMTRHHGVVLLSFVAVVAAPASMANLLNVQPVTVAVLLAGASLGARRVSRSPSW